MRKETKDQIISKQNEEIKKLKLELEEWKNLYYKINEENLRESKDNIFHGNNERGAGRKAKLSDQDKELIKMYRIQGYKIKELAEMFKCSIGLVSKVLNLNKDK